MEPSSSAPAAGTEARDADGATAGNAAARDAAVRDAQAGNPAVEDALGRDAPAGNAAVESAVESAVIEGAVTVVAIDGPSGSGKSTVARRVAQRLGYRYLDTGAMYRALTWRALCAGIDPGDAEAVAALAGRAVLAPGTNPRRPVIVIDGEDVSTPIRSREVTNAVSAVSAVPAVRAALVRRQRELMAEGAIVVEGRDIGTTVAPDAPLKIFLTASSAARAARRHRQVVATENDVAEHHTLAELERRDERDSTRVTSPLTQAPDAVVIDSTDRTIDQVVGEVLTQAARRGITPRSRTRLRTRSATTRGRTA